MAQTLKKPPKRILACMHLMHVIFDAISQFSEPSLVVILMNNDTILPHTRPHCLPVEDSVVLHIDIFPLSPFMSTFLRIIYANILK
jgi:hypothetical protein